MDPKDALHLMRKDSRSLNLVMISLSILLMEYRLIISFKFILGSSCVMVSIEDCVMGAGVGALLIF